MNTIRNMFDNIVPGGINTVSSNATNTNSDDDSFINPLYPSNGTDIETSSTISVPPKAESEDINSFQKSKKFSPKLNSISESDDESSYESSYEPSSVPDWSEYENSSTDGSDYTSDVESSVPIIAPTPTEVPDWSEFENAPSSGSDYSSDAVSSSGQNTSDFFNNLLSGRVIKKKRSYKKKSSKRSPKKSSSKKRSYKKKSSKRSPKKSSSKKRSYKKKSSSKRR